MICHTAETMDAAAKTFNRLLQKQVKAAVVPLVEKDRLSRIATKDYVVDCARIMNAWFAWHEERLLGNVQMSNLTPKGLLTRKGLPWKCPNVEPDPKGAPLILRDRWIKPNACDGSKLKADKQLCSKRKAVR
jgi:hypothetical protein